ncbi:MAG: hypothetical protein RSF83_01790 [Hungatella sp.]
MDHQFKKELADCEKVLIGIGAEWSLAKDPEVISAYESLYQLVKEKDYFIVTSNTDGVIYESSLDEQRITAPCGNDNWRQCSKSCTKDIWEKDEVPEDACPHCGALLMGNTVEAEEYIEEGYLPQWNVYTRWLATTLNRRLLIVELGENFKRPTVIRWPFEKTAFFNQKSKFYRVNESFSQISEEIKERAGGIAENSVKWIRN